jgi:thiol-disulfide isomerase/thioredoxin
MKIFQLIILLGILLAGQSLHARVPSNYGSISGSLPFLKEGDSVIINIYTIGEFGGYLPSKITYHSLISNHSFHFEIPLKKDIQYVDVRLDPRNGNKNLYSYLVRPHDAIKIGYTGEEYSFKGMGSSVWNVKYRLSQIERSYENTNRWAAVTIDSNCKIIDNTIHSQLSYLRKNRLLVEDKIFYILQADLIGIGEIRKYSNIAFYYLNKKDSSRLILRILSRYKDVVFKKSSLTSKQEVGLSNYYAIGIISKYTTDSCILCNKPNNTRTAYSFFKNHYTGILRERILTYLLFVRNNSPDNIGSYVNDALNLVNTKDFRTVLYWLKTNRINGTLAFNFNLPDVNDKTIHLSDFRDKVVVLDFWFTGCGGCRALLPKLAGIEDYFINQPVVFISICIDQSKMQWLSSLKEGKYTSGRSLNLYTGGNGNKDPIVLHYNINRYPTLILINKNGRLMNNPIDPRIDGGNNLIELIRKELK